MQFLLFHFFNDAVQSYEALAGVIITYPAMDSGFELTARMLLAHIP